MKRLVAIALTLILCLSLCFFAAAEETDVYGKYEEPIKLTILSEDFKTGNTNYDANDPRRASATQNVWIDAYKDYLNIDVERQIAEDETALAALINTAMASGDLPDVIICNKAMFYTLVENGVLQDVRAAYEGYQQKRLVKDALDSLDMWDACTVDGQLLAVPCVNNFYNNTQILWIRQDWLDKVNMEAPRTLDEMIAVAQAFKDAKLGGEDTIGIAMTGTTSHNYDAILAAYGAIAGCWQPKEDGTYEYAYVSDTAREGLLKMQEIYEKGLVVPDMAVCDDKTVAEQIANGRAGILSPHLGGGQRQRFGRSDHQPAQRPVRIGGDSGGSCPEQYPPPAVDPLWRPGLRAFFQPLAAGRAAGMPDRETKRRSVGHGSNFPFAAGG